MTLNYADLKAMKELASSLGSEFHFDTLISPRTDGGTSPLEYRLDVDRMVGLDLDREDDFRTCEAMFGEFWNRYSGEALNCGAGIFAFNVDPYGVLSPCTMFSSFRHPLKAGSFGAAWKRMVTEYGNRQDDFIPGECRSCTMLFLCPRCAAWAEVEAGNARANVAHLCDYAKTLERRFFKKKEARDEEKAVSKT
jgi:radical SAM protein with 4Fe4S-binding SPASM domain